MGTKPISVAFGVFLIGTKLGLGCTCGGPAPVCSVYWSTPILFLGHVVGIDHIYDNPPEERTANGKTFTIVGPGQNVVHFEVSKSYKGDVAHEVVVHTADQGSACAYSFETGHDYLVYAFAGKDGIFSTGRCTRTHEVTSRADDPDIQWMEALPHAPPGGSIIGQISSQQLNADGGYDTSALAGIAVSIRGPQSKTVASDAGGRFKADGLPPGQYHVSAAAPDRYSPFPNSTVTLQDRGCAELSWSTRVDGHIRGRVFYADGQPAAGAYMTAKVADAKPHEPWTWQASYTSAAADGSFDFSPLAPGSYVFAVNMDFAPPDGKPYYRRAFFPGTIKRAEAGIVSVGAGQQVDNLKFILPPDLPPPSIPVPVTVLGFDRKPVAQASVLASDDIWENSVTNIMASTDGNGKAIVTLRLGVYYDIEAYVNLPDLSQACAEPAGILAKEGIVPLILVLSHHVGNCLPFKKPRTN